MTNQNNPDNISLYPFFHSYFYLRHFLGHFRYISWDISWTYPGIFTNMSRTCPGHSRDMLRRFPVNLACGCIKRASNYHVSLLDLSYLWICTICFLILRGSFPLCVGIWMPELCICILKSSSSCTTAYHDNRTCLEPHLMPCFGISFLSRSILGFLRFKKAY